MKTWKQTTAGVRPLVVWAALLALVASLSAGAQEEAVAGLDDDIATATVRDPLKPLNRGIFTVNDKLFFWVLKPVARGYDWAVPQPARQGIENVFANLGMPRRGVNCLLQGKAKGAATEVGRFVVNSTVGCLGFMDFAGPHLGWEPRNEDFGQTLGRYGLGYGIYLTLPVLGPSNPRDTVGVVVDSFLDPLSYLVQFWPARIGIRLGDQVNSTSLRLGQSEYEKSKETSLDHYIFVREYYTQRRNEQIRR